MITFLRERLSTKSAELDKAQSRVAELELVQSRIDLAITKTEETAAIQAGQVTKFAKASKDVLELADNLLITGGQVDDLSHQLTKARASEDQANKELGKVMTDLAGARAEVVALKGRVDAAEEKAERENKRAAKVVAERDQLESE